MHNAKELDRKLKDAKKDTQNAEAQKKALEDKITNVQQQIALAQEQLDALDKQISQKESEIKDKQKDIDSGMEQLKARLRAIYMAGETSTIDIILGAKDFNDFLDKASLIKNISRHDDQMINDLKDSLSSIQEEKDSIDKDRELASETKKDLEKKQRELSGLIK